MLLAAMHLTNTATIPECTPVVLPVICLTASHATAMLACAVIWRISAPGLAGARLEFQDQFPGFREESGRRKDVDTAGNNRRNTERNTRGSYSSNYRKNNRKTGSLYEDAAAVYLEKQGCRIFRRNYYNRYGELDIIALYNLALEESCSLAPEEMLTIPGTMLIFCEVKFRTHRGSGDPEEAVTESKMRHICRSAAWFYTELGLTEAFPCRFDVISFLGNGQIRHIQDAFSFKI